MLRIGIMGAGHLGKIHIKCIQQIPEYEFVGFFDPDQENAKKGCRRIQYPFICIY